MSDRKYKILVVDDERSVLLTYRLLLERQGYIALGVASAREATETLACEPFDLLLCDLSLEEKDSGFKVIEFARAVRPGMPAVLVTGYASLEAAQRAENLKVPVLYKPVEIQEFLTTIPAVLRNAYEQAQAGGQ